MKAKSEQCKPRRHWSSTTHELTVIKGVELPPKVRAYLDFYEEKGDVPLYDVMAV